MGGGIFFYASGKNDESQVEELPERSPEEEQEYLDRRKLLIALYGEKPAKIFKTRPFDFSSANVLKEQVAKNHAVLRESWYADTADTEARKNAIINLNVIRSDAAQSKPELVDEVEELLWSATKDPDQEVAITAIDKIYWIACHMHPVKETSENIHRLCNIHASEKRSFVKAKIRDHFVSDNVNQWIAGLEDSTIALQVVDMLGDAPTCSPAYAASENADKEETTKAMKEDRWFRDNLQTQIKLALNRDLVRKQKDSVAQKVMNTLVTFSKDIRDDARKTSIAGIKNLMADRLALQEPDPDFDNKGFTALVDMALSEEDHENPNETIVFMAGSAMSSLLANKDFAAVNDIVQIKDQDSQFVQFFRMAADAYLSLMEHPSDYIRKNARACLQTYFATKDNTVCDKHLQQNLSYVRKKAQDKLDTSETIGEVESGYLDLLTVVACTKRVLRQSPQESVAITDYLEAQLDNENKKEAVLPYIERIGSNKEIAPLLQLPFLKKAGVFEFVENADEVSKLEVMKSLSYETAFAALQECNEKLDMFSTQGQKLTEILNNPVVQWLNKSHLALEKAI